MFRSAASRVRTAALCRPNLMTAAVQRAAVVPQAPMRLARLSAAKPAFPSAFTGQGKNVIPFRLASSAAEPAAAAAAPVGEALYSKPVQYIHWFMGVSIVGLVTSGFVAGQIPQDPEKSSPATLKFRGKMMHLHESFGLLMLALIVPRIGLRVVSKTVSPVPGTAVWQHWASKASHFSLYAAMVFMPVSGLAFGWASAWGVPFFWWDVPGVSKEAYESNPMYKKIEDFFYVWHHKVGQVLEFLVPIHIGAVGFHYFAHGQNILRRMLPSSHSAQTVVNATSEAAKKAVGK